MNLPTIKNTAGIDLVVECDIEVDHTCIANGKIKDHVACPVALAINKRLKSGFHASVSSHVKLFRNSDYAQIFSCDYPAEVKEFIDLFDKRISADPFSFSLHLPCSLVEKCARK